MALRTQFISSHRSVCLTVHLTVWNVGGVKHWWHSCTSIFKDANIEKWCAAISLNLCLYFTWCESLSTLICGMPQGSFLEPVWMAWYTYASIYTIAWVLSSISLENGVLYKCITGTRNQTWLIHLNPLRCCAQMFLHYCRLLFLKLVSQMYTRE